jgi:hypothetical protein
LDDIAGLRGQCQVPLQIRVLVIGQQLLHLAGETADSMKTMAATVHQ